MDTSTKHMAVTAAHEQLQKAMENADESCVPEGSDAVLESCETFEELKDSFTVFQSHLTINVLMRLMETAHQSKLPTRITSKDSVITTVDVLIQVGDDSILLIERAKEPFMDKLVLPGGHVDATDASLTAAAQREVLEELSLHIGRSEMRYLTTLDAMGRDPRPGRRISTVYTVEIGLESAQLAIAASDAKAFCIKKIEDLTEEDLGFDHWNAIVALQYTRLKPKVQPVATFAEMEEWHELYTESLEDQEKG